MKVHYINLLLFALPLNILEHNQSSHNNTIYHTSKTKPTKTYRTLCECELYTPNYDNHPEMKELIENFNHQTSERLREYDERMQDKRKQCKEQCEKDIQKIILKDKVEKELTEKFAILQTDIHSDAIPTCICEKSVADKTEKVCLNCGKTMGAVAPAWGLVSGLGYAAWMHYVSTTVAKVATDAGVKEAIEGLIKKFLLDSFSPTQWKTIVTVQNYNNQNLLIHSVQNIYNTMCWKGGPNSDKFLCLKEEPTEAAKFIAHQTKEVALKAGQAAKTAEAAEAAKYTSTTSIYSTYIIASVIAIVVIVLVMVIIYLILRYLRKKKMKKKLQYIKLLKE